MLLKMEYSRVSLLVPLLALHCYLSFRRDSLIHPNAGEHRNNAACKTRMKPHECGLCVSVALCFAINVNNCDEKKNEKLFDSGEGRLALSERRSIRWLCGINYCRKFVSLHFSTIWQ